MSRKHAQLDLPLPKGRGGKRKGAGRKPTGTFGRDLLGAPRAGVSHRARPAVNARIPLHVTIRTTYNPRTLRHPAVGRAIANVLKARAQRRDLPCRVIHFAILSNHLHLIVEAADKDTLARGMQGLLSILARVINAATGCSGKVWNDRYHARALATPREVRNCLVYVMRNGRKHGETSAAVDPFSSGAWFDGFAEHGPLRNDPAPCHPASVWLLTTGWRRRGLIRADEAPKDDHQGRGP
jgi:REP element-mobilizing transposase RayT